MHLVSRTLATLLVASLALAGCSDEPEPKLAPPETASPPVSAGPSPSREAWEEKSADGVEAFARLWLQAFYEAQVSGVTDTFRNLGPDCKQCQGVADQIETTYEAGGQYVIERPYRFLSSQLQGDGLSDTPSIALSYKSFGVTRTSSTGARPESFKSGRETFFVALRWKEQAWCITGFSVA